MLNLFAPTYKLVPNHSASDSIETVSGDNLSRLSEAQFPTKEPVSGSDEYSAPGMLWRLESTAKIVIFPLLALHAMRLTGYLASLGNPYQYYSQPVTTRAHAQVIMIVIIMLLASYNSKFLPAQYHTQSRCITAIASRSDQIRSDQISCATRSRPVDTASDHSAVHHSAVHHRDHPLHRGPSITSPSTPAALHTQHR
ncbi:hypothetical protein K505DRAFT_398930 [Melanomma pulvis-pyrius CBS 109.77]|uniref:Uncharacterized protein n=1 Tax=Melanomma pulvis-pyrius CBS 109.77 TaxID=1314802 RepID=A0A6A6WRQ2_9PLEO|nr:hypothetical protein K505DRAFT_398930 [Melanomma pulvis-pyrius CBS 109.77]